MHPFFRRLYHYKNPQGLPAEIYVSTIDALYSDSRSLFLGTLSAALAAAVTAWAASQPMLAVCAVLMALIGMGRGLDMAAYARRATKLSALEDAQIWEARYCAGSAAFVAVLGLWCFLCFWQTDDAAVQLISFAVSLGYLVGVAGRNFSSDRLVTIQAVSAGVPMIAALLVQGNGYYTFLAVLLAPFFVSIRFISARLRSVLIKATRAMGEVKELAGRFDAALTNMPHGLCMFDSSHRLVVCNDRFMELLGIPTGEHRQDMSAAELLREAVDHGALPSSSSERLIRVFRERLSKDRAGKLAINARNDRALELTFQRMENGSSVVLVEDVTERRNAEAKIEHMACYDALTGLPNRTRFQRQFMDVLDQATPERAFALHFVDLDQFKYVNDTLGHPCGDALLCAVSERLCALGRKDDHIARFGGDEFVLLQPIKNGGMEEASALASRIIERLSAPYHIHDHEIVIGASVGIAIAPEHSSDFDELLKCADMALYRAKADGRGLYRFFEKDMDLKAQARRALELDIRDALATDQFEVHYQPIVDLKTGRATCCEALVRWKHPTRGFVPPSEFVPIAEEMGLILELGEQVLMKACLECVTWPNEVQVAVNFSPLQFQRGNVYSIVQDALRRTGLPPQRLVVEITESVLLEDTMSINVTLALLAELGVNIALDDFGTGYSSLSYLHRFPLDKIKIDRSFVLDIEENPRTMTLLSGIAQLSDQLGMSVVVEGVETQEQLDVLMQEEAIDYIQGYLFGKPVPSDKIIDFLVEPFLNAERRAA